MKLSPARLTQMLATYIPMRLPVLITGRPGIGKSDIVEAATEEAEHDLLISHPVVEDPTDSKGLPFPSADGRRARFLPFGDLERALSATRPLVWFLDDLGQASPAVQAAKMQLLLARRIGEHQLPDCVTFVAATNRRSDNAGVTGILDPLISRFAAVVELEATVDDWTAWAVRQNVPPELIAFLRFRPDLLLEARSSRDIVASASPRKWGFLAKTMPAVPADLLDAAIRATVGEGAGAELISFLSIYRALPSVDAILLNPDFGSIPEEPSILYALTAALAYSASDGNFERVLRYADRLVDAGHREFTALLVRDATARSPELANHYAFIRAQGGEIGKIIRGE
ncbi:ATPase [Burkholderia vietnamiensis]|uniref:ATP-binding protein n=1 Tax=Burkholderia vietnamiensis TaxID=60552 RepID=UPI000621DED9|nr:ATP-binding protein [Burkholderia vietnamiensis]KKI39286.1 ATPase [Burkholderia vietnamiensis]KVF25189.1 ATPase [Burkholderia vietnamiensis]TPQ36191.1 ATP-binding protein [Burkholderia ubonensis]HDR9085997.1 ATP-binding protein [Burkholderia vietnamiensis]